MLSAGEQQRSVHVTSVQSVGTERIVELADSGSTQGIQRITFTYNAQIGHVTVLVIGETAYVRGDSFTLTNYMRYRPDAATTYSGQWIQIPRTDPDFKRVSRDVTLPSSVGDLSIPPPLRLSPNRELNGRAVTGVTGTQGATPNAAAITVSLYARPSGIPLPVEQDVVQGGYLARVTFSRWNERVRIAAPANAIPISTTGLE
jgi:hypothetical protein